MYSFIRPLLFSLDPETAHRAAIRMLRIMHHAGIVGVRGAAPVRNPKTVMGLTFPNMLGLAAGLDKNGEAIDSLGALGFGFLEVGTVTPRPQPGNPRPRLFRVQEANAVINRMGFNNDGVDALVERLKSRRYKGVLGVNIGKNADTPVDEAWLDYRTCMRRIYPYADYIAINISSPNTPRLRNLQDPSKLNSLIDKVKNEQHGLLQEHGRHVPVAIKISPDLEMPELERLAEILLEHEIDGVIATNTTTDRSGIEGMEVAGEEGGLSGEPLKIHSSEIIHSLKRMMKGRIPIIGVGGIMSGKDAVEKIKAGADLVQIYTGLIYRGPGLISEILKTVQDKAG